MTTKGTNGKITSSGIIGGMSIAGMIAVFTLVSYFTAPLKANDERLKEDIEKVASESERECEEVKTEARERIKEVKKDIERIRENIEQIKENMAEIRIEQGQKFGEILLAIKNGKEDK